MIVVLLAKPLEDCSPILIAGQGNEYAMELITGACRLMRSFELQSSSEEQNIDGGDCKISHLPDCILHRILSYLPTKEVVATSILSKRWKHLWTEVTYFDFDDSMLYSSQTDFRHPLDVTRFMNFVERVLLVREKSDMKRFRLSCRVCFSESSVHEWISAALRHNVQELDLCLFVQEPFTLPWGVFDHSSLTAVRLEMNCTLQLPTCISFPYLRRLHLCLVTFPNDLLMQKLFSSCPFLEELAILDCEWINMKCISIAIPSLKSLILDDLPFCSVDDLRGCEIKIDAENLVFFKYCGYLSNEIHIYDLSSSALALINVPILCQRQREITSRTFKLFRGLKNVSSLRISSGALESLFLADDVLDRLPIFENLTLLELRGQFGGHCIELLMEFLYHFPKLQSLHFCEGLGCCKDDCKMKLTPSHSLSNLKTVNYQNFYGTSTEIYFVKFLLKNAVTMMKMDVVWSKSFSGDPKDQLMIENQLHALPRGSRHCALVLT
ncbi:F-box/LRR-repeat protein At3g58900-like isoform X2 [Primulina huaijiensis]|uniref:F-box/LRR-repeat protein At3g58900-like isoform X2 n=2 Tax=Primulina huaijiensis TaxID=1492673 RepID=UPI003CC778A1